MPDDNTQTDAQTGTPVTVAAQTGTQDAAAATDAQTDAQTGEPGADSTQDTQTAAQTGTQDAAAATDAQTDTQTDDPDAESNDDGDQDGDPDADDENDGNDPVPYGRFKKVNTALNKAKKELERLPALEMENMRLRAAIQGGFSVDLAERLRGDTVEDMIADAQRLIAAVTSGTQAAAQQQTTSSPGVPPPSQGNAPETLPNFRAMTADQIIEWADRQAS